MNPVEYTLDLPLSMDIDRVIYVMTLDSVNPKDPVDCPNPDFQRMAYSKLLGMLR